MILLPVIALVFTSCTTTQSGHDHGAADRPITAQEASVYRKVSFQNGSPTFNAKWTSETKRAILDGYNLSKESHRKKTHFSEGRGDTLALFFDGKQMNSWEGRSRITRHAYHTKVAGFPEQVAYSEIYWKDPKTLKDLAQHEVDHIHGHFHDAQKVRRLRRQHWNVPESMTW